MRAMSAAVILMLAASGAGAAPRVEAPSADVEIRNPRAPGERTISIDFRALPLKEAIHNLFRGSGLQYAIDPNVPSVPMTMNLRDVTVPQVLRLMLKQAASVVPGLTAELDGGIWQIHIVKDGQAVRPKEPSLGPATGAAGRRVTLDLNEVLLRDAVQLLLRGSGLQWLIDPTVPNVPITLTVRDISVVQALRLVIRQAQAALPELTGELEDGVYRLYIARTPIAGTADRKVTLDLRAVPLRDAIALIFRGSGLQYLVDPKVPGVPITMSIRDITLPQALRLVVKQAAAVVPGLSASRDGEIWFVHVRPTSAAGTRPLEVEAPPQNEPPPAPEWEKTPLHYVRAQEIARWLGAGEVLQPRAEPAPAPRAVPMDEKPEEAPSRPAARSLGSAFFPRPGGLRDRDEEQPASAPAAVRLGEVPPLPRGILQLYAVPADNSLLAQGTPEALRELRALVRMVDVPRRQLRLRISAGKLSAAGTTLGDAPLQLSDRAGNQSMNLTTVLLPDGENALEVSVSGAVTLGGAAHPLKAQARIHPGQATQLLALGEGARQVKIWVRAELLPDAANTNQGR